MITALQSSKHNAADALRKARAELLSTVSLRCMPEGHNKEVNSLVSKIDAMYEKLITNDKPHE